MKNKICVIISLIILLAGLGLFSYPSLSNYVNKKFAHKVIVQYEEQMQQTKKSEIDDMLQKAHAYNQSLYQALQTDQFNQTESVPDAKTAASDLPLLEDGAMLGHIEIERVNIHVPVYYGTSEMTLQKGSGVIERTSLPVGGSGTHSVISGHAGLPSKKLFTDLEQVKEGDLFFLNILDQKLAYRVDQIKVVEPTETEDLRIVPGNDYVTLLTCTPYGVNTHRLLVRGERIAYDFSENKTTLVKQKQENDWLWILVAGGCMVGITGIFVVRRIKQNRKGD